VLEDDAVPLHAVPLMRGAASVFPTLSELKHAVAPHRTPTVAEVTIFIPSLSHCIVPTCDAQ